MDTVNKRTSSSFPYTCRLRYTDADFPKRLYRSLAYMDIVRPQSLVDCTVHHPAGGHSRQVLSRRCLSPYEKVLTSSSSFDCQYGQGTMLLPRARESDRYTLVCGVE